MGLQNFRERHTEATQAEIRFVENLLDMYEDSE